MESVMNNLEEKAWDCVVIGGGLAGLTTSIFLARSGKSVLLVEKSATLGGRAITEEKGGGFLNLGPHALYSKGRSLEVLEELGIVVAGGSPNINGKILHNHLSYDLPGNPLTLLVSQLFKWSGKKELIRLFTRLEKLKTDDIQDYTLSQWLHQNVKNVAAKKFILMLLRLSTYCNDPDFLSAGAALRQLQLGRAIYLHYGWQSMVDDLKEKALSAGVTVLPGCSVQRIGGFFPQMEVLIKDKGRILAQNVLSTANPTDTAAMLKDHEHYSKVSFLNKMIPVRAACLDIVFKQIPNPKISFALGMDQPLYFSNHSKVAKLSRHDQSAVVHVLKYLSSSHIQDEARDYHELEQFLGQVQPGWEKLVLFKRYLPRITVSHSLVFAEKNGVFGRPDPVISQIPGLYVAGDWVGPVGMLADATFASAKQAASSIIERSSVKEVFAINEN